MGGGKRYPTQTGHVTMGIAALHPSYEAAAYPSHAHPSQLSALSPCLRRTHFGQFNSHTSKLRCTERLERIDVSGGLRLLVPLEIAQRYDFGGEVGYEE